MGHLLERRGQRRQFPAEGRGRYAHVVVAVGHRFGRPGEFLYGTAHPPGQEPGEQHRGQHSHRRRGQQRQAHGGFEGFLGVQLDGGGVLAGHLEVMTEQARRDQQDRDEQRGEGGPDDDKLGHEQPRRKAHVAIPYPTPRTVRM